MPGTPDDRIALRKELRDYEQRLGVVQRLRAYGAALTELDRHTTSTAGDHYFLLELDAAEPSLQITAYRKGALVQATEAYLEAETLAAERTDSDAVLVSVDSIAALRRAYPNYFADTSAFGRIVLDETRPARRQGQA